MHTYTHTYVVSIYIYIYIRHARSFSDTFLILSSNLYHLQDNALGITTDPSALLMKATCISWAKICWVASSYPFAPDTETVNPPICGDSQCPAQRPHFKRRLQVIRLPHRGTDNRVGQNPWFREGKENNAAILDQCTWAKIGICFTLFNQPPRNGHYPPRPAKH